MTYRSRFMGLKLYIWIADNRRPFLVDHSRLLERNRRLISIVGQSVGRDSRAKFDSIRGTTTVFDDCLDRSL